MYRALVNSARGQLPEVVTIDFREPPRASELSPMNEQPNAPQAWEAR